MSYLGQWLKSDTRKPLILRGARQVGKSTLIRLFAKERNLKLVEINFEKNNEFNQIFSTLDVGKIISSIESRRKEELVPKTSLLFFDEIQACPEAIMALRYFYEDAPDYKVIAAGSLLDFSLTHKKFSMPVGRVEYHYLGPLSFEEFLNAKKESYLLGKIRGFNFEENWPETLHEHLLNEFRTYLFVGGMPEIVQAYLKGKSFKKIRTLQQNLVNTYRDDFAKYATKTELEKLQTLYQRFPQFLGKKIKYSELIPGERSNVISSLVRLLEKAGIIHLVTHSDCNGIPMEAHADRRIAKAYWLDCGLLNQMLHLEWDEISKGEHLVTEGLLAEQFVAQELIATKESTIKPNLHYWLREGKKGNAEVDFVIQRSAQIIPIEVKSGKIGRIKSLSYMVGEKKLKAACRISKIMPSKELLKQIVTLNEKNIKVSFHLYNLPLYLCSYVWLISFKKKSRELK